MAVPDINHKVCMLCDHYDEKDCPYCGMGFEGFEIKKHEQQIRAEVLDKIETKILGNCASMLKDGERVIVIKQDIFKFILK